MLPPSWILRPCLEDSLPKLPLMDDITFCYNSAQRDWIHLQVLLLMDNTLHQVNCIVLTQFVHLIFAANGWRTVVLQPTVVLRIEWMIPLPVAVKSVFLGITTSKWPLLLHCPKPITPCNKVCYEPEKRNVCQKRFKRNIWIYLIWLSCWSQGKFHF